MAPTNDGNRNPVTSYLNTPEMNTTTLNTPSNINMMTTPEVNMNIGIKTPKLYNDKMKHEISSIEKL